MFYIHKKPDEKGFDSLRWFKEINEYTDEE